MASIQYYSYDAVRNVLAIVGVLICQVCISCILLSELSCQAIHSRLDAGTINSMDFRQIPVDEWMNLPEECKKTKAYSSGKLISDFSPGEIAAILMLETDFGRKKDTTPETLGAFRERKQFWEMHPNWSEYLEACKAVWDDVSCFPVAKPTGLAKSRISYEDSWMYERTYGGKRLHEGTDLFPSRNLPGIYPVVSMTDGIVMQKGWLKLGGYRIGILAPRGAYFYYAHLDSYAELEVGDRVLAGQFLGYMGDTGYSEKEGTRGNFPVHLHVGIYLLTEKGEISVNPYPVLRYIENDRNCSKGARDCE